MEDVKQTNEQMLDDIRSLQKMEQQLMDQIASNSDAPAATQQKWIDKVNSLSTIRINMYKTLGEVNSFAARSIAQSAETKSDQMFALKIVEEELNHAKHELKVAEEQKNNQIRLIEINAYFGEKYTEHTKLLKIVAYTLFGATMLFLLHSIGLFPASVFYIILVVGTCVAAYYFWKTYADILLRDNINYDEYIWPKPSGSSKVSKNTDGENATDPWTATGIPPLTCIGDQCCSDGLSFDATKNQCVPKKEGFAPYLIEIYTKKEFGKDSRPVYNMNELEPYGGR